MAKTKPKTERGSEQIDLNLLWWNIVEGLKDTGKSDSRREENMAPTLDVQDVT